MSDNQNQDDRPVGRESPDGGRRKVRIMREMHYTHPDGRVQRFLPGEHEVPDEVADHWYFQAHTEDAPDFDPPPGTLEHDYRNQGVERRAQMEAAEYEERRRQELEQALPEGIEPGSGAAAEVRRQRQAVADRVTGMSGSPNPQRRTVVEEAAGQSSVRRSPLPEDNNKK